APNKLNEAEVEKMRKEAEQFADADKKRKEEVETINEADNIVHTTEKSLKEMEGKISETEIKAVKDKVDELKKLLEPEKKDIDALKAKIAEVMDVAGKAATELYQKAAQEKQAKEGKSKEGPNGKTGENIFDAEFVDKDKNKK
ncbi:MAG: Hsp70 family protein, partial [Nanoarchaeota archaeon]